MREVRAELPRDLPIVERDVVRLVVRDSEDRILLFHARETTAPELGAWWELPGGGIDEGETYLEAALRELREETGIVASSAQVGPPDLATHGIVSPSPVPTLAARGGSRSEARWPRPGDR